MLDSIFIVLFISGFLLTLISHEEESVIYSMLALIIWLTLFVQSLWIVDVGGNVYNEFGLSAICLGFVLVNLVSFAMFVLDWLDRRKRPF